MTYGTDPSADVRATRVEDDQEHFRVAYDAPSGPGLVEFGWSAGSTSTMRWR